eukprot:COSAG02_NODE_366_length_23740_cov_20.235904_12_plen_140_part_00
MIDDGVLAQSVAVGPLERKYSVCESGDVGELCAPTSSPPGWQAGEALHFERRDASGREAPRGSSNHNGPASSDHERSTLANGTGTKQRHEVPKVTTAESRHAGGAALVIRAGRDRLVEVQPLSAIKCSFTAERCATPVR